MGFTVNVVLTRKGKNAICCKDKERYEGSISKVYSEINKCSKEYIRGHDYPIGSIFKWKGRPREVVKLDSDGFDKGQGCGKCCFNDGYCKHDIKTFREDIICQSWNRNDRESVFYRIVTTKIVTR